MTTMVTIFVLMSGLFVITMMLFGSKTITVRSFFRMLVLLLHLVFLVFLILMVHLLCFLLRELLWSRSTMRVFALLLLFVMFAAFSSLGVIFFMIFSVLIFFVMLFWLDAFLLFLQFIHRFHLFVRVDAASALNGLQLSLRELSNELRGVPNKLVKVPWHPTEHLFNNLRLDSMHLVNELNHFVDVDSKHESLPFSLREVLPVINCQTIKETINKFVFEDL